MESGCSVRHGPPFLTSVLSFVVVSYHCIKKTI